MKNIALAFSIVVFFTAMATADGRESRTQSPDQSYQVAQSDMCPIARENADTCHSNWESLGGGSSGQAGSFRDCTAVYCQAMIAAGCDGVPSYCSQF